MKKTSCLSNLTHQLFIPVKTMTHLYHKTLFALLIISGFLNNSCFAQENKMPADSTASVDTTKSAESFFNTFDNQQIYQFKKLINTNFNGFADVVKNNSHFQVFHFAELGRPRYIAPVNMYPQQSILYFDGVRANDYINGMFNTRFLSLDRVESIRSEPVDSASAQRQYVAPLFYVASRNVLYSDAYTRLKYYEGDFNYTDLDITFASKYGDNVIVRLAGFNKGYEGTGYNNEHTSVNYHTTLEYKLSHHTKAFFDFYLNHERSGMANAGEFSDFTYRGDDQSYALKFIFDDDSTSGNLMSAGFRFKNTEHSNQSKVDSFNVANLSDNYTLYFSKAFKKGYHNFETTFSIENHIIWGTAFKTDLSDRRFAFNLSDKITLGTQSDLKVLTEIEQLNDFNPLVEAEVNWQIRYGDFISGLSGSLLQRYPVPLEREYNYNEYSGNKNLESEKITKLEFVQNWFPYERFMLKGQLGYAGIDKEITLENNTFVNGGKRSWFYLDGESQMKFWDLIFSAGGRTLSAKKYISSKNMLWGQLAYHGIWFNKTIVIDATANVNWYSSHDKLFYNPIVQRFYTSSGENPAYSVFSFKLVGTVSSAEIFLEMDNLLKTEIKDIEGYSISLRQVRFGVNWDLWK